MRLSAHGLNHFTASSLVLSKDHSHRFEFHEGVLVNGVSSPTPQVICWGHGYEFDARSVGVSYEDYFATNLVVVGAG